MDLFDITQTRARARDARHRARQARWPQNLANANTPGYQRKDVDFHGALQRGPRRRQVRGRERRLQPPSTDRAPRRARRRQHRRHRRARRELAQNGLEYEALVSVATARIGILAAAMGIG